MVRLKRRLYGIQARKQTNRHIAIITLYLQMQAHFGSESIISPHNKTELNANETWFTGVIDSDLNNQSK